MTRITFHLLVGWLKAGTSNLFYRKLLLVGFLSRDDRNICGQSEVDARIGYQGWFGILSDQIQGSIISEGSSDGRHNLANKVVKVSVLWVLNVEVSMKDVIGVIDCLL